MFQNPSHKLENLRTIESVHPESLKGKRVLVRCDFNVPVSKKGKILNTVRIDETFRTINYLKNSGAKIILISHIGRDSKDSLAPVFYFLNKKYDISFVDDLYSYTCKTKIDEMQNGQIVLFENLRKWEEESNNDLAFAKKVSDYGEIFVNEAFSASHREHASIVGIPVYLESYIGFRFKEEFVNLSKIFKPEHPFLVLVGGAKFKTKMKMVESLENKADSIFVGGALANDIYRTQGFQIGSSTVSDLEKSFIERLLQSKKIFPPVDVKTVNKYGLVSIKKPNKIKKEDVIVDGGPNTFKELQKKIKESKFIVWNGPFGWYEKGYDYLTKKIAKELAKSSAFVIAGGGDTLVEIKKLENGDKFDFVSLAGGAMLEFISKGTLPGIEVIKQHSRE